jgi:acetyl esterase/lipase
VWKDPAVSADVELISDIEYGPSLALDLYRPAAVEPRATVLYLHGGGWAVGHRTAYAPERLLPVARHGVAVASASYRFSDVATYPAQLHDVKGAVRWLRAHATELGIPGERIGAWGASAGGHLALLLGLTSGARELEGDVGGNLDRDSAVQAVCAWFAPSDLVSLATAPPSEHPLPPFAEGPSPDPPFPARLLGLRRIEDDPEAAHAASPLAFAARGERGGASYLLVHGDADGLVSDRESRRMHAALLEHGADSSLVLLAGANHEGPEFHRAHVLAGTAGFFLDAL